MNVWAVVPAKPLAVAKARLAPLLTAGEREALARVMLTDVLAALHDAPALAVVMVVSADPAALELAAALGARPLAEPAAGNGLGWNGAGRSSAIERPDTPDHEAGLNAALDYAASVALDGGADALLALPADVPLVTPEDVAALIDALPPSPSAVLASTADGGTGALLRSPPLAFPARFGPRSLQAHTEAAARHAVPTRLVRRPNLALDIDRPADLLRLVALPLRSRTQELLAEWRLPDRRAAQNAATSAPGGR